MLLLLVRLGVLVRRIPKQINSIRRGALTMEGRVVAQSHQGNDSRPHSPFLPRRRRRRRAVGDVEGLQLHVCFNEDDDEGNHENVMTRR